MADGAGAMDTTGSEDGSLRQMQRPPVLIADLDDLINIRDKAPGTHTVKMLLPEEFDQKYSQEKRSESCAVFLDNGIYKPTPMFYKSFKVEAGQVRAEQFGGKMERWGFENKNFLDKLPRGQEASENLYYETPAGRRSQQTEYGYDIQSGKYLPDVFVHHQDGTHTVTFPKLSGTYKDLEDFSNTYGVGNFEQKLSNFNYWPPSDLDARAGIPGESAKIFDKFNGKTLLPRDDMEQVYFRQENGEFVDPITHAGLMEIKAFGAKKDNDCLIFNPQTWALNQPAHVLSMAEKQGSSKLDEMVAYLDELSIHQRHANKPGFRVLVLLPAEENKPSRLIGLEILKRRNRAAAAKAIAPENRSNIWIANPTANDENYTGSYSNLQVMLDKGRYPNAAQARQLDMVEGNVRVSNNEKGHVKIEWVKPAGELTLQQRSRGGPRGR
ncbi:hypothetical protein EV217_5059 [Phyllobacterium myrsinacearum]|uniref:hypothetical protein n=1 Tax=Phyllobacterium myrsinacearum TaxID=28101 RepID=UPI00102A2375|nr:hypothetical protein [Phyllobacterium myrsinacearum]RZS76828.1 hypothetical protein EV217_5059 [Phyllobacterium myrsinacearum]